MANSCSFNLRWSVAITEYGIPFVIMNTAHYYLRAVVSVFFTFDFFSNRCSFLFDVSSSSTFFSIRRHVPIGVFSFDFLSVDVFYRRLFFNFDVSSVNWWVGKSSSTSSHRLNPLIYRFYSISGWTWAWCCSLSPRRMSQVWWAVGLSQNSFLFTKFILQLASF